MEEKLCSKYKHLLVLYSKDDLPYIDDACKRDNFKNLWAEMLFRFQ